LVATLGRLPIRSALTGVKAAGERRVLTGILAAESGPQPKLAGPESCLVRVAEDRRFELLRGCPQHAFQACALGH